MLHAVRRIRSRNLWANFASAFLALAHSFQHRLDGREPFLHRARLALGVGLLCAACAYWLLQRLLLKAEGPNCLLARAVGGDWKGSLTIN